MGIRAQIGTAFTFALAAPAVATVVGIVGLNIVANQSTEYTKTAEIALTASETNADMAKTLMHSQSYIMSRDNAALEQARDFLVQTKTNAEHLSGIELSSEQRQLVDTILADIEPYSAGLDQLSELYTERDRLVYDELDRIGPVVRRGLTEINETATADGDFETANKSAQVQEDFLLARLYAAKFLMNNRAEDAARGVEELAKVQAELDALDISIENPARSQILQEITPQIIRYANTLARIAELIEQRNQVRDETIAYLGREVSANAAEIKVLAAQDEEKLAQATSKELATIMTIVAVVAGLAILIALAVAVYFGRSMSRPINELSSVVSKYETGDLSRTVPFQERKDEIGSVARSIDKLRSTAKGWHETATRIADQIEAEVGEVIKGVASAATELSSTADQLSGVARTNSEQVGRAAEISKFSTTNVQTVASAAEELSASIGDINNQLARADEIAKRAGQQSAQAEERMTALSGLATKIGEIVALINQIAEQTNLLALNATIESARAGDAGKGFAVVAQEVKSLAGQTGQSSDEIRSQVEQLQIAAQETGREISAVQEVMSELIEIATSIASAMSEQSSTTIEIAQNTQKVAAGNQDVTDAIGHVEGSTDSTREASGQVATTAVELARNAETLQQRFSSVVQSLRAA